MNKKRREEIKTVVKNLEYIKSDIERILQDEEYAYDNMPENLQGSMRGSDSEDAIDMLTDTIDLINETIDLLNI